MQDGILDIGGFCMCFEPSNLPLHAFQVMLPFGTMNPEQSLAIAQDVYAEVPYMTDVFEEEFNQVLLSRIADGGYNMGSDFAWETLDDLQGHKIGGAGLNLNWLENAGIVPVSSSLATAYTEMTTGVYEGWIMFPSAWVNLKLYEPGPYYNLIGFGSITWHAHDHQQGHVRRAARGREADPAGGRGRVRAADRLGEPVREYDRLVDELRELITVTEIDPAVRQEWAESMQGWVQRNADELEGQGLPAKQVLNLVLDRAEARGYEWPVRYTVE